MKHNPQKDLPAPRGITIEEAAALLRYSRASVRRLIKNGVIVAWKPAGARGRKWLVDEISLAAYQAALIEQARAEAAPVLAEVMPAPPVFPVVNKKRLFRE